jgi:cytochrome c oxidase subunit 2
MLALPEQASTMAFEIDVLHFVVVTTSVIGAVGVAAAVGILLLRYHHGPGAARKRSILHPPVRVEVVVIFGLLAMFLAFWIVGFRQFVKLQTPPAGAMDVYVVAKQWMWEFAYPDGMTTTDELYVPANRPVRLIMTSRDVIHSFSVPSFRIKHDVVPGRSTMVWFEAVAPGEYQILCAEYCGTEHSFMRGKVIVLDAGDYAQWAEGKRGRQDLVALGRRIATDHGCLRCHTVDGTPHLGPTWAGLYGSHLTMASGDKIVADEAYLTESMMDPLREIRAGFTPIMPTYRGILEGVDVAALVAYIKSLPAPGEAPESPLPQAPLPPAPVVPPQEKSP